MSDQPTAARHYQHAEHESVSRALRVDADVRPQSPIGVQLGRLHEIGTSIETALNVLRDRLEPVMAGIPPMPEDGPTVSVGDSPTARELDVIAARFERFIGEIDTLGRRLEV